MTKDKLEKQVASLNAKIEAELAKKEALMVKVDGHRAKVQAYRAELGPLTKALAALKGLDDATVEILGKVVAADV